MQGAGALQLPRQSMFRSEIGGKIKGHGREVKTLHHVCYEKRARYLGLLLLFCFFDALRWVARRSWLFQKGFRLEQS